MLLTTLLIACHGPPSPAAEAAAPPFVREASYCEQGVVIEHLDAGSYSYLAYETDDGIHWIATLALLDPPAPGSERGFTRYGRRTDFHSQRLDRDFDELGFGFVGGC